MKAVGIRVGAIALVFASMWFIAGILQVPAWQIAGLFSWGIFCMLFSYELGGAKRRYRQGFEERNWLERAWLFAGVGCLIGATIILIMYL